MECEVTKIRSELKINVEFEVSNHERCDQSKWKEKIIK